MLVLNCPDGAVARDVVEVLASARLRFKPVRGGAGSVGDSGPVHLNVLRDGVRVYVGDPPGTEVLHCELSTLVVQLLPRHLVANLTIVPFELPKSGDAT
ncbi:hypothetical protein [Gloeobacter morelensis]|uniref:Uncharacterized protein n=1 Tax=Gloeobacter morelensis MG652769 TaxID=2781736 RepID=A0ABY3PMQ6_9CYAN|nr:hypothetical protein [Gloeobacter morelensis]UFP94976.1 hypothetical protein ISF26_01635 [Gloeobacter morelensis MG652769]